MNIRVEFESAKIKLLKHRQKSDVRVEKLTFRKKPKIVSKGDLV